MKILRWFSLWLLIVAGMCLQGALVGGVLFPLAGSLLGMDLGLREMVLNGIKDGAFLALIWAPGTGIIVCFMRSHYAGGNSAINGGNALDSGD